MVDNGSLNSTNTSFGAETLGVPTYSYVGSTLADIPGAHHSVQYSSPLNGSIGFGHDDAPGFLPLSTYLENSSSDSALGFGNLESVPGISADAPIAFDYDYGHDDLSSFPFDDYLNIESDPVASVPAEVVSTSQVLEPDSRLTPDSPSNSRSSFSSSPSALLPAQVSSNSSLLVGIPARPTSLPAAQAAKLEISPALSFKCPKCPTAVAFKSQLTRHMDTHTTFVCTFQGCISEFKTPRDLKRHLASFHKTEEPMICAICGHNFYRKDKYKEHMKKCPGSGKKRKRIEH